MTFPLFYSENFLRENGLKISKIPELSRIFVDNLENSPNFDFFSTLLTQKNRFSHRSSSISRLSSLPFPSDIHKSYFLAFYTLDKKFSPVIATISLHE